MRTVFIHAYNNTRESDNGAPTFSFAIRRWIIKTHGRRHVEKHVCGSGPADGGRAAHETKVSERWTTSHIYVHLISFSMEQ